MKYAVTIIIDDIENNSEAIHQSIVDSDSTITGQVEYIYVSPVVDVPPRTYAEPVREANLAVTYPTTPRPETGNWAWDVVSKSWVEIG